MEESSELRQVPRLRQVLFGMEANHLDGSINLKIGPFNQGTICCLPNARCL